MKVSKPQNEKELDIFIDKIVKELERLTQDPVTLYLYVISEIDGASQGNLVAQEMVKNSGLFPCEYDQALQQENCMDEPDSALSFMHIKLAPILLEWYGMNRSVVIRCRIVERFMNKNRNRINEIRLKIADVGIMKNFENAKFKSVELWEDVKEGILKQMGEI